MRIVVTGGAGFIGSEVVTQLAATGHRVTVIDNLVNGKADNLAHLDREQVRLVVADIRDRPAMERLLKGADIVHHLACLGVRHSLHAPEENHAVNATGTLGLLQAALEAGVRRFVYVSSSEVYGTARRVPMQEDHPTYPMTVYGGSKLAGEAYTRAYFQSYGFATVVVRPFNAFGPRCHHEGDSGEVIPKFMLRAMAGKPMVIFGDGRQTRDFTYVSDTARGIILAGESEAAVGQTLNIGQGREITIRDLAQQVATAVGRDRAQVLYDQSRPGDVLRLFADSGNARGLLGYEPRVSLAEGLVRLHRWYLGSGLSAEQMLADERLHNWQKMERVS